MNSGPKSILLIDDDKATNFVHKRVIREYGFTGHLQVCYDAESALAYLKHEEPYEEVDYEKPDLIMLDINMPGMDGWEFLEEYKKLEIAHQNGIIIMMLTTSINPEDRERALREGIANDFRLKPLTEESMDEIIETYFRQSNNDNNKDH